MLVLAFTGTGLAVVRCLATSGARIYAAVFPQTGTGRETRVSRHCKSIELDFYPSDQQTLLSWLLAFAGQLGERPLLLTTSDQTALFLAANREVLAEGYEIPSNTYEALLRIISKDGLYRAALEAGVPIPATLIEPTLEELSAWCETIHPPYIAKPFFAAVEGCSITGKNRVFTSISDIQDWARQSGTGKTIIQQMLACGDGHVYDAYGYCDRQGNVLTLASHRRLRQYPSHTGATSFGEIPASQDSRLEEEFFQLTRQLLAKLRYHGIFGIEWMQDRETGRLYLADFNARPFSSIGHLADCGLNLPLLAYLEYANPSAIRISPRPPLRHLFWTDFNCDIRGFRHLRHETGESWLDFIRQTAGCRSFAFFSMRDPLPGLARLAGLVEIAYGFIRPRQKRARPRTG